MSLPEGLRVIKTQEYQDDGSWGGWVPVERVMDDQGREYSLRGGQWQRLLSYGAMDEDGAYTPPQWETYAPPAAPAPWYDQYNTDLLSRVPEQIEGPGGGGQNSEGDILSGPMVDNPVREQMEQILGSLPGLSGLESVGPVAHPSSGIPIMGAQQLRDPATGNVYNAYSTGQEWGIGSDGGIQGMSNQRDIHQVSDALQGYWRDDSGTPHLLTEAVQPNLNTIAPYHDDFGITDAWIDLAPVLLPPIGGAFMSAFSPAAGAATMAAGEGAALAGGELAGAYGASEAGLTAAQIADGTLAGAASSTPWESVVNYLQNVANNPLPLIESAGKRALVNAGLQTAAGGDVDLGGLVASSTLGAGLGAAGGALGSGLQAAGFPDGLANFGGNAIVQTAMGANPENIAMSGATGALGNLIDAGARDMGIPSDFVGPPTAAFMAGLTGGDPLSAAIGSGVNTLFGSGMNALGNAFPNAPITSGMTATGPAEQVAGTSEDAPLDQWQASADQGDRDATTSNYASQGEQMDDWISNLFGSLDELYGNQDMSQLDFSNPADWGMAGPDPTTQLYLDNMALYGNQTPQQLFDGDILNQPVLDGSGNQIAQPQSGFMGSNVYGSVPSILGAIAKGQLPASVLTGGNVQGAGAANGGGAAAGGGVLGNAAAGGNAGLNGLLLPLIGGLLGAMGGSQKPAGTTTTVNDIPEWQKPYVTGAFNAGKTALDDAQAAYAAQQPMNAAAGSHLRSTIAGDYLNNNPYLDATYNKAANTVSNRVNSQFSAAGRYGSGAHTGVLTEGLGNLATDIYGGNYQQERQRQFAGSLAAPSFGQGVTQSAFAPAQGYANIVRQPVGNTQTQPYYQNQWGSALSGLLGGAALGRI